jgi:hypothetical protein
MGRIKVIADITGITDIREHHLHSRLKDIIGITDTSATKGISDIPDNTEIPVTKTYWTSKTPQ